MVFLDGDYWTCISDRLHSVIISLPTSSVEDHWLDTWLGKTKDYVWHFSPLSLPASSVGDHWLDPLLGKTQDYVWHFFPLQYLSLLLSYLL